MSYKNWSAICAITDQNLKFCVACSTDEKVLEGLQRGFPELFTEEKPEHDGPWPLSVIRRAFDTRAPNITEEELLSGELEIPFVYAVGPSCPQGERDGRLILTTSEENELLEGWEEAEETKFFPYNLGCFWVNDEKYYVAYYSTLETWVWAILVPATLVDENS